MDTFRLLRADESFFDALTTLEDSRPATGPGCTPRADQNHFWFREVPVRRDADARDEAALNVAKNRLLRAFPSDLVTSRSAR